MPYLLDEKQLSSFFIASVSRRRSGNIKHVLSLFLGFGGGFPSGLEEGGDYHRSGKIFLMLLESTSVQCMHCRVPSTHGKTGRVVYLLS